MLMLEVCIGVSWSGWVQNWEHFQISSFHLESSFKIFKYQGIS